MPIDRSALPDPGVLASLGEHLASGYYEMPDAGEFRRWARAYRRHLEHRPVPSRPDSSLVPSGALASSTERIITRSYSFTWIYHPEEADAALERADLNSVRDSLGALRDDFERKRKALDVITTPHTVGGRGYTHSIPNYGRVLSEGLDGYGHRIAERLDSLGPDGAPETGEKRELYEGLLDLIEGVRAHRDSIVALLRRGDGPNGIPPERCARLLDAYERVPFAPARSFFDALVCYDFVYYIDGCDNPGRFDQELVEYYRRDLSSKVIDPETARGLVSDFYSGVDANGGWSLGIGGTGPDGAAGAAGTNGYNKLTTICLEAARRRRRPNLQLNVRRDMPDEVWDAALDCIASGCGLPALYDDERFNRSLEAAELSIEPGDLWRRNGGGCTETMMHGVSNVGSLDAGINLPLVFSDSLRKIASGISDTADGERSHDPDAFERFVDRFLTDLRDTIRSVTGLVNADQKVKAALRPQPIRTLLVDDCIDRGVEFNSGGARYNWSVVNVAGLANVADSLEAVRCEVYERRTTGLTGLIEALDRDFVGFEPLRQRLASYPKYGNDIASVDSLARRISEFVFRELRRHRAWRGGTFLASCLMFVTYANAGAPVPATPDGRRAGTAIADSAGPMQGRDRNGPTAMLRSVASIRHDLAPGTLVVNVRFSRRLFATPAGRRTVRKLIETYFDLGGMQIQINVIDQSIIEEAIRNPEAHEDLIVRVGGYSEYFNRLSADLKRTILERVEHFA